MNSLVRRNRLTKLANKIEGALQWNFDMDNWGEHSGDHRPKEKNYCGTAVCALGTAALMPEFRRAGLKSRWVLDRFDSTSWVLEFGHRGQSQSRSDIVSYGAEFFGLSLDEAEDLFLGTERGREEVVAFIRELAAKSYDRNLE